MLHAMRAALAPLVLILGLALIAACGDDEEAEPRVRVVTTTNIVADWAQNVAGDDVEVFSLLPVGADPHSYQPGAQDVARISDADVVFAVGLGLEESWLVDLVRNAATDPGAIVELGELIDPIEFQDAHAGESALLEAIAGIVHEVEDGHIPPEQGLIQIGAVLLAMEEGDDPADVCFYDCHDHADEGVDDGHDHDDEGDDDGHDHDHEGDDDGHDHEGEFVEVLIDILTHAQAGEITPAEAIEAIDELVHEMEEDGHEGDDHGHDHGLYDPHFWFDPLRVKVAVDAIAARLAELDPDRGDDYRDAAASYKAELDELHGWTAQQVEAVPQERRLLLTSHESLGYFAALYGFDVVGVILSTTTEATPSAADLAELAHEIEELGVPAVFGETTVSERLAVTLADETGVALVRLYSGSLGAEGSGAESYIGMVRANVTSIVDALR
ncbi:MAG: zinc ABC transporter substrate-binding protein [Chloroflexi bacterium]|nr:zinc ABC transporter substrate-binding protein [Chloroflexota bacterium]